VNAWIAVLGFLLIYGLALLVIAIVVRNSNMQIALAFVLWVALIGAALVYRFGWMM
jgi:hypothetical protein